MSDSMEVESTLHVEQTTCVQVLDETTFDQTSWCSCGQCNTDDKNKLCCKHDEEISTKSGSECITQHTNFKAVCLNKDVLSVTREVTNNDGQSKEIGNDEYRRIAYSNFQKWIGKRRYLPSCVTKSIGSTFPGRCLCGQCIVYERIVCCNDVDAISQQLEKFECITQHDVFKNLCLKKVYLFTCGSGNEKRKTELTNDDYLRIARRNFVRWIWGQTDSNEKLPCCVLEKIWSEFPSESISKSDWLRDGIGTMVIINNERYLASNDRHGSEKDVERLKELADNLNIQCRVIENKGYDDIITRLRSECRNVIHSDLCFICVILSHGAKNHTLEDVKGDKFKLNWITATINKEIVHKDVVKLCFVQACRGDNFTVRNEDVSHVEDPGDENFLITYCSVYGHAGTRNRTKGTPFIDELCKSFNQSHGLEIMQALTAMKRNMEQRENEPHRLLASSTTRLTKELHLKLKTTIETVPPSTYSTDMKRGGLFVIVADQGKFQEDINALRLVAKLWGFKESNIKTPCSELRQETKTFKFNKVDLLNKIESYVRGFTAISCFVCAIRSETKSKDKFDLNYVNDSFNLKEITTLFREDSVDGRSPADALKGQPKLFFVQKPPVVETDAIGSNGDRYLPQHPDADVMITFSEEDFRDNKKQKGISAFYDALLHCVTNDQDQDHYDLFKILTKVRRKMTDQKHPVPWTQTQLRSEVLFSKDGK